METGLWRAVFRVRGWRRIASEQCSAGAPAPATKGQARVGECRPPLSRCPCPGWRHGDSRACRMWTPSGGHRAAQGLRHPVHVIAKAAACTPHTLSRRRTPRAALRISTPHHTPAGSPRGRIWHVRRLRAGHRRHRQGDRPAAACKTPPRKKTRPIRNNPSRKNPPGQTVAGFIGSRAEPFMRAGVIPVPGSQSPGSADHPSCPRRHGGGPTAPAPPRRRHQRPS